MTNPPVFCDGNCGAGEQLPEFIDVYVPLAGAEWADYSQGVRYKFDVDEPTRCVWTPEVPTVGDWDIEKLSRYPSGWLFPATEPVADRWTWRLSIDRTHIPLFAGGWTASFPRFVAGQNDPMKACLQQQSLVNYVPIVSRPQVAVVPVDWPIFSVLPRNVSTGCFCTPGCQPGKTPYQQYFLRSIGTVAYPDLDLGKLMIFDGLDGDDCIWVAKDPEPGPDVVTLRKGPLPLLFGEDGRFFFQVRVDDPAKVLYYFLDASWSIIGGPFPDLKSQCDLPYWLPASVDESCLMMPCPEWVCDDEQARAWYEGIEAVPE